MPEFILNVVLGFIAVFVGFALGLSLRKPNPVARPIPPQQAGNAQRSTAARERAAHAYDLMQSLPTDDVVYLCGYGSRKSLMAAIRRYDLKKPVRVQDGQAEIKAQQ